MMKKEIRYRIHLQHEDTGTITSKDFSYAAIFSGAAIECVKDRFKRHFIIGKSEFTGRTDSKGNRIYENDIIEFDSNEWGDNTSNIHKVTWDNENSGWSFGGGSTFDMEWRTVIGNKFDNPELWERLS